MVLNLHTFECFIDIPRLELTVFTPAEDCAFVRQSKAMLAACSDICELHGFEFHIPVVSVGGDVFSAVLEHFNLHRVYGLLDDKPLVVALGDA